MQGHKDARIWGCKGVRVQGHEGIGVWECKSARVWSCKGTRSQEHRGTKPRPPHLDLPPLKLSCGYVWFSSLSARAWVHDSARGTREQGHKGHEGTRVWGHKEDDFFCNPLPPSAKSPNKFEQLGFECAKYHYSHPCHILGPKGKSNHWCDSTSQQPET